MAKEKLRLDIMLKEQGLAPSRTKAQALIMAGCVRVDGSKVTKAGFAVSRSQKIELMKNPCPFVSRGGLKLQRPLEGLPTACFGTGPDLYMPLTWATVSLTGHCVTDLML